jgi:hypothetical protein
MRTSIFSVLSVLLLFSAGCATRYEYTISIEHGEKQKNAELVKNVDSALSEIAKEFSFAHHSNRTDDNGQQISFYYKHHPSYSYNRPVSILFFQRELIIKLSSNAKNTDEIEKLKRRLLEELEKIVGGDRIKVEEEDVPRPWFDSV